MEESAAEHSTQTPLEHFPSSSQPVTLSNMKDMLISLRDSLHIDMMNMLKPINASVHDLQQRMSHTEHKMEDAFSAHNNLVDAYKEQQNDLQKMAAKLADMEDRSRRNNIKFRGIPESITTNDLQGYIRQLLRTLVPNATDMELTIDRAHRLPKPSFLPDTVPRDVLTRIHYYHIKEEAMRAIRKNPQLTGQFAGIALYTDLSQATIQHRKKLLTITKALRNHNISYRWGTPSKLTVTHLDKTINIFSLEAGLKFLKEWGILPTDKPMENRREPSKLQKEWS